MLRTDENRVWWLLSTLVDQALGEVSAIALIGWLDVAEQPKEGASVPLSQLPQALRNMGFKLWNDAQNYLDNSYIGYELKPVEAVSYTHL